MEIKWKEYSYKDKKLSFTIQAKEINGVTGNHLEDFVDILLLREKEMKNIFIDGKELKEKELYTVKRKIAWIPQFVGDTIHNTAIEDQLIEYMKQNEIYPKNLSKKVKDALKIVGLEEKYLKRNIYTLSSSEKKQLQMAQALLGNPEVIVLEEPLKTLDIMNQKKMMMVLKRIKDQFEKTIVIVSNNPNILYQYTNHLIIFKNDQILTEGNTKEEYERVDFLKKHKVEIPEIVEFTYLAKKNKKAKIDYYKDIRDLIKDIYKHV